MNEDIIILSHGSGGKMTSNLIKDLFIRYFDNEILSAQTDSAVLNLNSEDIAFTTDSYVVNPIFFNGGNIGKLAICGTVNDLTVSGAVPKYISVGFILEEGLKMKELEEIVKTMSEEAKNAGVKIVTGDTKVVEKGKCDKIFINTSGIGILDEKHKHISFAKNIKPSDKIIINGSIGDHATTILAKRNDIKSNIKTDCASLNGLIKCLSDENINIKFMRDATRGGLGNVLCELAKNHKIGVFVKEELIPVKESVKGLCEMFGFDPLFMANEGKVIMIVSSEDAKKVIDIMINDKNGVDCAVIGELTNENRGKVILETEIGGKRIVDMPAGEQLPRIC